MLESIQEPANDRLLSALESVLLVAGEPTPISALARALQVSRSEIETLVRVLQQDLHRGILVQILDDSVQLVTAPRNVDAVRRYLGASRPPSLSRASLETLTIVAYQQLVTRSDIESIRGVNSDRAMQTLLARNLIEERGRRQAPGRPVEYGTTFEFLSYFGLRSLDELPALDAEDDTCLEPATLGLRLDSRRDTVGTSEGGPNDSDRPT